MNILPIPEGLLFLHGYFKLIVAAFGFVLLILTIRKHFQKHSRISLILIPVFLTMVLGMVFGSFDDLFGWKDLLGPETWVGFGISQIFNSCANVSYFALYIEIFLVKEQWEKKNKLHLLAFAFLNIGASISIFGYYSFHWPIHILIPTITTMILGLILYTLWLISATKILNEIEELHYRKRFHAFQICGILLFVTIVCFAVANMSESSSLMTWIGFTTLIVALVFTYKGFLAPSHLSSE